MVVIRSSLRRKFDEVVAPHLLPEAVRHQEFERANGLVPIARIGHAPIAPHLLDYARVPMKADRTFRNPVLKATRDQAAWMPASASPLAGPQGRAHLAVYDDTGRSYRLAGYKRSEWAVVSYSLRNLLARLAQARFAADVTYTLNDEANTARINGVLATAASTTMFNETLAADNAQTKFKYGSGVTAPAETDVNIQTALGADITAAGLSYDDAVHTATMSGSRLHVEAGSTINEIACFSRKRSTAGVVYHFLTDHTAISPGQPLITNQTVAISYVWQF